EFDAAMGKTAAAKPPVQMPPAMGSVASGFAAPAASQGLYQQAARPVVQQPAAEGAKAGRVNAADKRVINGTTDVNQLVPF
ncbi:hypothetical protein, partial [Vibrio vulnificus]